MGYKLTTIVLSALLMAGGLGIGAGYYTGYLPCDNDQQKVKSEQVTKASSTKTEESRCQKPCKSMTKTAGAKGAGCGNADKQAAKDVKKASSNASAKQATSGFMTGLPCGDCEECPYVPCAACCLE
jgi:uncharacterized protein HemX